IHGQHEHQSLLRTDRHLEWLDQYDEEKIVPLREQYRDLYTTYTDAVNELADLQQSSRQMLQMLDLYQFQLEEIDAAGLKSGEDEWLEDEKRRLGNTEKLMKASSDTYDALYANGHALDNLSLAIKRLEDIEPFDS